MYLCVHHLKEKSSEGVKKKHLKMSKNCHCDRERDLNNNYVGYSNGCLSTSPNNNRNSSATTLCNNNNISNTASAIIQGPKITQIQAKVMFGSIGAIKELREKEHAEKARSQAGRRH